MWVHSLFPRSWLVQTSVTLDTFEVNNIDTTNGTVNYTATFGSVFTVMPQVSLVYTGINYPFMLNDSSYYGWVSTVQNITQDGAVFTTTANNVSTSLLFNFGI